MKNIEEALESVNRIYENYYQTGTIKQFTIDLIEYFVEQLNDCVLGEIELPKEIIYGSLSYKASIALEICDHALPDFCVIQELYDAVNG